MGMNIAVAEPSHLLQGEIDGIVFALPEREKFCPGSGNEPHSRAKVN